MIDGKAIQEVDSEPRVAVEDRRGHDAIAVLVEGSISIHCGAGVRTAGVVRAHGGRFVDGQVGYPWTFKVKVIHMSIILYVIHQSTVLPRLNAIT